MSSFTVQGRLQINATKITAQQAYAENIVGLHVIGKRIYM